jgi:outer membrane receptor protein involved in Fe transport
MEATLHELLLMATWNHRSGFFSQIESALYSQANASDVPGPGDEFWQHNIYAGYRFRKRAAEIRVGLLNIANQDYRLNPLNLHRDLPRERTFTARLRLNF